jgi:hypothetical protein
MRGETAWFYFRSLGCLPIIENRFSGRFIFAHHHGAAAGILVGSPAVVSLCPFYRLSKAR